MQDRGQLWSPISAKYHLQSNTKEFFKTPLQALADLVILMRFGPKIENGDLFKRTHKKILR